MAVNGKVRTLRWPSTPTKLNPCNLDSGDRAWAFRFTALDGKRAQMEFAKAVEKATGRLDEKSLAEAREMVRVFRVDLKRNGIDPRVKKRTALDNGISFKGFADSQYPNF